MHEIRANNGNVLIITWLILDYITLYCIGWSEETNDTRLGCEYVTRLL